MGKKALIVENLSKRFRIGLQEKRPDTLAEVFYNCLKYPVRNFRMLRSLTNFDNNGNNDESIIWALKDINFEVEEGDIIGIIGKNGAGKSTLLKILSRITPPTSGSAKINGRVSSLLEVGTGFHPELTGRENIYLNGTILGMSKAEIDSKFDEIVAFSEIEQYIDTPVKRYSSGMGVRLAFAVAAHLETEIMIIDEVLAVGDVAFQNKCIGKMGNVAYEGRTIVLVSHNMALIDKLCSKSIMLNNGEIVSSGNTFDVIRCYLDNNNGEPNLNNLLEFESRTGKGDIKFSSVEIFDENYRSIKVPLTGKRIIFRLHLQSSFNNKLFKNCRVSIGISNSGFVNIVLSSEMVLNSSLSIRESDNVEFIIDKLPVTKGKYSLTLFLESNGVIQDWLKNSISFYVEDGDYYNTGKVYPDGHEGKTVLIDYSFNINKCH